MNSAVVGDIIAVAFVAAAALATGWVLRNARARRLPRRKALTRATLQWIEFPLFLWLYRRIRPKHKRRLTDRGGTAYHVTQGGSGR
jgi:hypothetical protein